MREEQILEAGHRLKDAGRKLVDLNDYRSPKDVSELKSELAEAGEALVAAGEALAKAVGLE